MTSRFEGKTALVTGGSRGIGRAIAEQLAREGATVALTYNSSPVGADDTVGAIQREGGTAFALHSDLSEISEIPQLFEGLDAGLIERTGSNYLDILVNNAGNSGWGGIVDATESSWDALLAVHARAPLFIVQSALSRLSDGGRVINISSAAATRPMPAVPVYSMAKASINNLTHSLAIELGARGITVNAVAPGWVRTDMNTEVRANGKLVSDIESDTALGRFGEVDDIADVVSFLASDEARWVTGQVIEASGGYKLG